MKAILSLLLFGYGESCGDEPLFMGTRRRLAATWDYGQSDNTGDYHLGATWAVQGHSMCNQPDQSPIDINTFTATKDSSVCSAQFDWTVDMSQQTFKVGNNGHSLYFKPVSETINSILAELEDADGTKYQTLSYSENTIASFPNYFKPEGSEHDSFCLDSAHFHWGLGDDTGSEHTINGYQFPLELHFVHYSCAKASLGSTLENFQTELDVLDRTVKGEDTHQLGVVGVMFDVVAEDNPAFTSLFSALDKVRYPPMSDDPSVVVKDLDLSGLIPSDLATRGYYAYEGSLTTPPCTNIVRWHVMNARQTIGVNQIEQFRALMIDSSNKTLAPNYRETMPAFNEVFACGDWEEVIGDEKENDDNETLSTGWIVSIVALVLAAAFLLCFVVKSFKVQALEQEIKDIAQMNRSRVNSEKRRESVDVTDVVNGVQTSKGTMEMGDMQKV
jgi:carbonic anhydrase